MRPFTRFVLGKEISHVVIGLKTCKGSKQLKLDPSIYQSIVKQRVEVGDVIYIEANTGAVKVILYDITFMFVLLLFLEMIFSICAFMILNKAAI